ncbi:hypothetical protein [Thermoactinomyces sp. DSM 45892]|uniref:hypothetical protein n=1 Tax=Thermoactinomyces sp. DSM 45892 TaxID=1882753 RepID=UPI00089CF413|nr:hypothetical protein [Thermoactinomyces sp. DSM 45892]SDZ37148.1 hypothetical protein SAMN05444416_12715 [Thermoactinomyces sp. DSM 45892]
MKKVLFILSLALVVLFGANEIVRANEFNWTYFETEDGKWDGRPIVTTKSKRDVEVNLGAKDGRGPITVGGMSVDGKTLKVRLCNTETGACTSNHHFAGSEDCYATVFDGMKPGTYRIDITDGSASYRVRGYVRGASY